MDHEPQGVMRNQPLHVIYELVPVEKRELYKIRLDLLSKAHGRNSQVKESRLSTSLVSQI